MLHSNVSHAELGVNVTASLRRKREKQDG